MRNKVVVLLVVLGLLAFAGVGELVAQQAQVTGVTPVGSAVPTRPVYMGGRDASGNVIFLQLDASGRLAIVGAGAAGAATVGNPILEAGTDGANTRTILTDASGRQNVVGAAAAGAAVAGNPLLQGAKDGAGNAQATRSDVNGVTLVSPGVNWLTDTTSYGAEVTSNGVTAVTLGPALVASQRVFCSHLFIRNESTTVGHKVSFQSSGGQFLFAVTLGFGSTTLNGGNAVVDGEAGSIASKSGEAMQFFIDGGGAATDVKVSCTSFIQKALN